MKIEIYYNKENDCLQMVQDGELKTHDEYINGCEFLNYFEIENVEEFKTLSGEHILEGYRYLQEDFKCISGKEEIKAYFENVKKQNIQGKLIACKYI